MNRLADLWMKIAIDEIGISEISGVEHNERILEYHSVTRGGIAPDEIPWCASFVCWVLNKAGFVNPKSKASRDFIDFGLSVSSDSMQYGDIVLLSRTLDRTKGHVGFLFSETEKSVNLLGGNQGNQVSVSPFDKSRIIYIGRPGMPRLMS